jgi:hypothetical protein
MLQSHKGMLYCDTLRLNRDSGRRVAIGGCPPLANGAVACRGWGRRPWHCRLSPLRGSCRAGMVDGQPPCRPKGGPMGTFGFAGR